MMNNFEVGQAVTVDTDDYLNTLPGVILDVSSSACDGTMYCVDVEEQGTHYFYQHSLLPAEEEAQLVY